MLWEFYINLSFRYKYLKIDTDLHRKISVSKIPNASLRTEAYWERKVTYFRKQLHFTCLSGFWMRLWCTFKLATWNRLYTFRPQLLYYQKVNSFVLRLTWNIFTDSKVKYRTFFHATQLTFTCPKSTIETLEKGVKYLQTQL